MKNMALFRKLSGYIYFLFIFLLPACKISEESARKNFLGPEAPPKKAKAKRNDCSFLLKSMLFRVVPAVFGAMPLFGGFGGL